MFDQNYSSVYKLFRAFMKSSGLRDVEFKTVNESLKRLHYCHGWSAPTALLTRVCVCVSSRVRVCVCVLRPAGGDGEADAGEGGGAAAGAEGECGAAPAGEAPGGGA